MTRTIESVFVTQLGDMTLNMIEDERGDIFWGYGHREGPEFIDEVNRYLIHECGVTVPDDLFAASTPVEHLWAKFDADDEYLEHFTLVNDYGNDTLKRAADVFPVTRLKMR
jgi:hypothetical protein